MYMDHVNRMWVCPRCGNRLTPEAVLMITDEAYRPSGDPLETFLQDLLDYEIEGVLSDGQQLTVEYPRR